MTLVTTPALGNDATLEAEARSLVAQYLVALEHGDTATIRTLIGGALLQSQGGLLDNPDYSAQLISAHQNKTLSVTASRTIGSDQVEVDLLVEESPDSQFGIHLLVAKSGDTDDGLRIVSEY